MGTPRRAEAGPASSMRDLVESALEQEDIMPLVLPALLQPLS